MTRIKLSLLFLILPLLVVGQEHYSSNIAIGGKGGVSFSRVMFSPSVPQTLEQGTIFGGMFRYVEEKHFGFITELNFEQRGWKEKFEGYDYQYNRKITYIQLPILTHIYFGSSHFHIFFNAGPEIGYLIGSKISSNFDYNNVKAIEGFPSTNRYTEQMSMSIKNKFDYGISAGVGMEWLKGKHHSLLIEGRFYYGLGNIYGSNKSDVFSGSNSMSIMVSLGYFYRIK